MQHLHIHKKKISSAPHAKKAQHTHLEVIQTDAGLFLTAKTLSSALQLPWFFTL